MSWCSLSAPNACTSLLVSGDSQASRFAEARRQKAKKLKGRAQMDARIAPNANKLIKFAFKCFLKQSTSFKSDDSSDLSLKSFKAFDSCFSYSYANISRDGSWTTGTETMTFSLYKLIGHLLRSFTSIWPLELLESIKLIDFLRVSNGLELSLEWGSSNDVGSRWEGSLIRWSVALSMSPFSI